MLTAASKCTPPRRFLYTQHVGNLRALGDPSTARVQHHQQTRHIFGHQGLILLDIDPDRQKRQERRYRRLAAELSWYSLGEGRKEREKMSAKDLFAAYGRTLESMESKKSKKISFFEGKTSRIIYVEQGYEENGWWVCGDPGHPPSRVQADEKKDGVDKTSTETDSSMDPEYFSGPMFDDPKFGSVFDDPTQYDSLGQEEYPQGLEEKSVTPEALQQYGSSIETVDPGHFIETTAEDLRAKYGEVERERCTFVESIDPDAETDPVTQELNEQHTAEDPYNEPDVVSRSAEEELSHDLPPLPVEEHHDLPPLASDPGLSKDAEVSYKYDKPTRCDETTDQPALPDKETSVQPKFYEAADHDENEPLSLTREELSHVLDWQDDPRQFNEPRLETDPVREPSVAQSEHDSSLSVAAPRAEEIPSAYEGLQKLNSVYRGQGRQASSLESSTRRELESRSDSLSTTELLESLGTAQEGLDSVKRGPRSHSSHRDKLESSAKALEQLSDAHDEEATVAVQSAKAKGQMREVPGQGLTGCYVRDFPEEFEKNWRQTLSSVPAEPESSEAEAPVTGESMNGGLEGAFGRPAPSKIQPALVRHNSDQTAARQEYLPPKGPQDLEGSYHKDCGKHIQPLLDKQHGIASEAKDGVSTAAEEITETAGEGTAAEAHVPASSGESISGADKEPVIYKILAWDPTMQTINIAQTSSLVPDFASALSPADALLRISHPTKFLPHFASLEAEGFEIASGSGDVLVFRKVRPSKQDPGEDKPKEGGAEASAEEALAISQEAAPKPKSTAMELPLPPQNLHNKVNPIDMTGRPPALPMLNAMNYSPIGFVKYDEPDPGQRLPPPPPPPPPRVAYNINLRREEPVYSGPKFKPQSDQRQKQGLIKRLLAGGVWVAGISYGLGVVLEYFTDAGGSAPHDWDKQRK